MGDRRLLWLAEQDKESLIAIYYNITFFTDQLSYEFLLPAAAH